MPAGRVLLHRRGPALWPEYLDIFALAARKREVGTPVWNTMYQAEEGGLSGEIIWRELFHYYDGLPVDTTCFMGVDVAISKKTTADETAISIVNVGDQGTDPFIYWRYAWHGRVGMIEAADTILDVASYYKPVAIGVEAVAYQAGLVELLGTQKYQHLPVEPQQQSEEKMTRWLKLGAAYERGVMLHHPSLQSSMAENQLVHLPTGKHDDIPDSLDLAIRTSGINMGAEMTAKPAGFL